jgi:YD repeat-containing protein
VVGATGSLLTNTVDAAGNVVNKTVDTAGNVVNKTVDTAGNVVGKTLDTATGVVGKTFDAAGNVVGKTFDAAGNVVGKTFDAAGNVVGKTFDAAGNVLGSAASRLGLDRIGYQQSYGGPVNTSTTANTNGYPSSGHKSAEYRPGSNNTGIPNYPNSKPNDPYTYNGALQSKGGNFMAVTADFSRFGR